MSYILFLVSILVATFYYFRMAKRFNSFDLEITEELHKEMSSLILDFNQSANQNITILEDRMVEGKSLVADLVEQIKYLKQIKEGLDIDIKDLQKKIILLKEEKQKQTFRQKNLVQQTYDQMSSEIKEIQAQQSNKDAVLKEDHLDISTQLISNKIAPSIKKKGTGRAKKLEPNIPLFIEEIKKEDKIIVHKGVITGIKEEILEYYARGWDPKQIALELSMTKGEVDLIIQLFYTEYDLQE